MKIITERFLRISNSAAADFGIYKSFNYYKNDILHRDHGPSEIAYDKKGNKIIEVWRRDGKYHREDGPAIISYHSNGKLQGIKFFKNGDVYAVNDFCVSSQGYDITGKILETIISINRKKYNMTDWLKEKNIILSKENNYEIPDEYKIEAKLRFC